MEPITFNSYADENIYSNHSKRICRYESEYVYHSHELFELIFFLEGDMTYAVDGKEYKLNKNDIVFTRPFDIHCLKSDSENLYERYNILFDKSIMPFDLYEKIHPDVDVISMEGNRNVQNLFDKIDYYSSVLPMDELRPMLSNLISEICINIIHEAKPPSERIYTNAIVSQAINYIDEHLTTLSGIEEICNELYITKSHLHHLFIKHLKISPKKYVITKRLALAQRELCTGAKPTEVYTKCGFSDYSAFYRAYKSRFGCTPSEKTEAGKAVITNDKTPIQYAFKH